MVFGIGIKEKRRRLVRLAVVTVVFLGVFAWTASAHGSEISGPLAIEGEACGTMTLVLGPDGQNEYRVDGCAPLTGVIIGHTPLEISVSHAVTARDSGGNYAFAVRVANRSGAEIFLELTIDPRNAAAVCSSDPSTAVCIGTPGDSASSLIPIGGEATFSGFGNSAEPTELGLIFTDSSDGRSKVVALEIP